MSHRGQPSKNDYTQRFTYVAQKPKFLENFGKPSSPDSAGPSKQSADGREPIPERPREGRWAGGSDDEGRGKDGVDDEDEDEWGETFGGGGEDGPQVVVLKEGRHLSADQVKRERRRAAGKPSQSPPPTTSNPPSKTSESKTVPDRPKPQIPKPNVHKRKLLGAAAGEVDEDETKEDNVHNNASSQGDVQKNKKKKKSSKASKGLLSFTQEEDV